MRCHFVRVRVHVVKTTLNLGGTKLTFFTEPSVPKGGHSVQNERVSSESLPKDLGIYGHLTKQMLSKTGGA